jgi:uncharacterized protein
MSAFIEAIEKADHALVRDFLDSGASPEAIAETGDSALAIACQWGDAALVEMLLDAGADPNALGTLQWPLDLAAGRGEVRMVEMLLDHDADVASRDEDHSTALMSAAAGGHLGVVALLLEAGANPKDKDRYAKRAISYAIEKGHVKIVEVLAPLSTARDRQQAEVMLRLVQQGPCSESIAAFWNAAEQGDIVAVRNYLSKGGEVDAVDDQGRTALMKAASKSQPDVLHVLVEHGANVNLVDLNGCCAVEFATGHPASFNYLYPRTSKTLRRNVDVLAPILAVQDQRQAELKESLVAQGSPDERVRDFHQAVQVGDLEATQVYLDAGGLVDAMDEKGNTATLFAANNGQLEVLKVLIANGANANHQDLGGTFPLIAAGIRDKCYCYQFLHPLTEERLRRYSDEIIKKRNVWWW